MNAARSMVLFWRLITTVRNWPVYFFNRFGKMERKQEVRFKLWNGITIIGRPFSVDRAIINEEWLDRCYEPNDVGIHWNWSACKTILDVGAHIGTFTMYAAAHAKNAHVIAFEPEPSNAAVLRKNIAVNDLESRVHAVEAAVSNTNGTATFHLTTASASGGHSMFQYTENSKTITVPMISLESIFADNNIDVCDFLKLDCEGAEYDALYSLSPERLASIRFIAMEYHHFSKDPRHTPAHLKTFLEHHSFTVIEPSKSIFFAYRKP